MTKLKNNLQGNILGVVLAGGNSRRFGSDKALAKLGDQTLMERAIAALGRYCGKVIVVGRESAPVQTIGDWPRPGCGPLGGLAAALRHGAGAGFTSVLSCGVDTVELPGDCLNLLCPAPAFLESQPVIGHWPVAAASQIEAILLGGGKHSVWRFATEIGACAVHCETPPSNINHPEDLAALHLGKGALIRPARQK